MEKDYIWNLIAKKLSGEASPEELTELEEIFRKNPDLHYSMQSIMGLWYPKPHFEKEKTNDAYNRHIERMKNLKVDFQSQPLEGISTDNRKGSKKEINFPRLALSAGLLLAIFLIVLKFFHSDALSSPKPSANNEKAISEISTKNGSKTSIVLPDGTAVWLNAGSKLTYDKDYGNSIREVNLSGEAFFDVVKNKEKPFIIHTSKMDIKVLGTKFNVKSYPMDKTTETTLIRGSIEVSLKDRASQKLILKPNEKLVLANDETSPPAFLKTNNPKVVPQPIVSISHLNYFKKDSTIIETAWLQNKFIFTDEAFNELTQRMERWYSVSIHFEDHTKEELRFTGVFENESIQQALDALKLSGKFNYSIKNNEIIILK